MKKKAIQLIQNLSIIKINYMIFFITILLLKSCVNYAEKEIIYIPDGYSGTIAIIFNQKKGLSKEYSENSRVYRIPDSGILFTQFAKPKKNSYLNQKIYFINNEGKIIEEIYESNRNNIEQNLDNKIYKFNMFNISIKNKNPEKENDYIRGMYVNIGQTKDKDSLIRASHKKMEKFMSSILMEKFIL